MLTLSRPAPLSAMLLVLWGAACRVLPADPVRSTSFSVGGQVAGLVGGTLVLANNANDVLTLTADGAFFFAQHLGAGAPYHVTIQSAPPGLLCQVAAGDGLIGQQDVDDVRVGCQATAPNGAPTDGAEPGSVKVGGRIRGLTHSGLVLELDGDRLAVPAGATRFAFPKAPAQNAPLVAVAASQPAGLTCTVGGDATVGADAGSALTVTCSPKAYALTANVLFLAAGETLTLSLNGALQEALRGAGAAAAPTLLAPSVPFGSPTQLAIAAQPETALCTLIAPPTTMPPADTAVTVTCQPTFQVAATVSGLVPNGRPIALELLVDGATSAAALDVPWTEAGQRLPVGGRLTAGTSYRLQVASSPGYACTVGGSAVGTIGASNVGDITVACSGRPRFVSGQAATVVIGQPSFTASGNNRGGAAVGAQSLSISPSCGGGAWGAGDGTFYVADAGNGRVLGFSGLPATSDPAADFVVGQPDPTTTGGGPSASTFVEPVSVTGAGNTLAVADGQRVLFFNSLPRGQVAADALLGQADFVSNIPNPGVDQNDCPTTQYSHLFGSPIWLAAGGPLWVADSSLHRALMFASAPTHGVNSLSPIASVGQSDVNFCVAGADDGPSATHLTRPSGIYSDGTRMFLSDADANRVLVFDQIPSLSTHQAADHVIGQADFTTRISGCSQTLIKRPQGIGGAFGMLAIADIDNHRVLVYNSAPAGSSASYQSILPDVVLGQIDFDQGEANRGAGPTASSLFSPSGVVFVGTSLVVADAGNGRLLVYDSL